MERTVLLVDDDPNVLRGLARALKKQPYQLYTATSGEEAAWTLKTNRIDVVVADEEMPGMRGGDLLAWVAQHYPEVMRIVLTGNATVESAVKAINEGNVYQYFTKPFNVARLAVGIRKALESQDLQRCRQALQAQDKHPAQLADHFARKLKNLDRVVAGDLRDRLLKLSDSFRELEGEYEGGLDHETGALVDDVLVAAAEIQLLVDALLADARSESSEDPSQRTTA